MLTNPALESRYRMERVDPRTHTTAALEREFDALSVEHKLKAIWFNGRETNGTVADAVERIGVLETLVKPLVAAATDANANIRFVKTWGGRGTAFIVFCIIVGTFAVTVSQWLWG